MKNVKDMDLRNVRNWNARRASIGPEAGVAVPAWAGLDGSETRPHTVITWIWLSSCCRRWFRWSHRCWPAFAWLAQQRDRWAAVQILVESFGGALGCDHLVALQ